MSSVFFFNLVHMSISLPNYFIHLNFYVLMKNLYLFDFP